ncbi:MAG: hypothetical protein ACERKK_12440 [Poseidonibacter sp.]|uniref:hypothetical protein n=1 Tax=Poseidonibacter sp. TaxID=2321188 RepID=UPI00359EC35B
MLIKIVLGFFLIALAETFNGIFRVKVLSKKLGIKKAKLLSFLLGGSIVLILNLILVPWIEPKSMMDAFSIGFTWMSLMLAYDIFVGKVLFRLSWEKTLEDFNIFKGNLLSFGLLLIVFLPIIVLLVKN